MLKFIVIFSLILFGLNYLNHETNDYQGYTIRDSQVDKTDILDLMNKPLATPNPVREVFNESEQTLSLEEKDIPQTQVVYNSETNKNASNETIINNTIEFNEISITEYDYNTNKLNSKILLEQERSIAKINENFGIIMFYMCDYGVYPNPNLPNKTSNIMFGLADTYKLILTEMC